MKNIGNSDMKYAVITYIFGKNQEIFREPKVIDDDIEYICITDQKDLTSKHWKIIYEPMKEIKTSRDKVVFVKFNPFKYTSAKIVCVIDGSLEITNSLSSLFVSAENVDLLIKKHPERDNLKIELETWVKNRHLPIDWKNKFEKIAKYESIDLTNKFLLEGCVIVYNKTKNTLQLCEDEISYLKFLGDESKMFYSNQCVLTFLIEKNKNVKYDWLNQKTYFTRYARNSSKLADR